MADKKDGPPKGSDRPAGDASKRPYATIDLKATEVPAPSDSDAKPGKPAASTKASAGTEKTGEDQAAAAARVSAAASAVRPAQEAGSAKSASEPRADPSQSGAPPHQAGIARRYGSHLAAGALGGLLALVGTMLAKQSAPNPELERRISSLEQSAKATPSAQVPTDAARRLSTLETGLTRVDDLGKTLTALQQTQAALAEQSKQLQAQLAGNNGVSGRIGKLEEQLSVISSAAASNPDAAARIPQLAQIMGKLTDLDTATNNRIAALRKDVLQETDSRVAAVTEASEAAKSGTQRLDREVAGVKSDTARIVQRVDALKTGTDRLEQSLRTIQGDTTNLEAQIKAAARPADISTAVAPLTAKMAAVETSLQGVVRADDERKSASERIVLSLELGNLKRALDRGGSYAPELAAVKRLAGTRLNLAPLERYQHDGVSPQADLVREYQRVANTIIDADAEQPDASLVDRLLSGARSIVRVRKVDHRPDDTSTEAIVGRMQVALKEGRMNDVLAEARKLPAKAAVPAQDWLKKVEARQAVDASLAAVDAALKASLAGTAPAGQKGSGQ